MLIPDKSNYALIFTEDNDYRYHIQIINDKDIVCCSFRIPVDIYDELMMYIMEKRTYGFVKEYPVVTIEIPPNSLRYKYILILLNTEEIMIVKQMDLISKQLISEYYINYENI